MTTHASHQHSKPPDRAKTFNAFPKTSHLCLDGQITNRSEFPVAGGGTSDVWKGFLGAHAVSIKVIRPFSGTCAHIPRAKLLKRLWREYLTWSRVSHPNIIECRGFTYDFASGGDIPALISTWMPNGDVKSYIYAYPGVDRLKLVLGVAEGICYLHTRDPVIVHGDIRAENVLASDTGDPCLTDFGVSKILDDTFGMTTSSEPAGSLRWMAPELFFEVKMSVKSDVWSFGMTVIEIFFGLRPYHELPEPVVLRRIMDGETPSRPATFTEALWAVCKKCWNVQPERRHSMREVELELTDILSLDCDPRPILAFVEANEDGTDDLDTTPTDALSLLCLHSFDIRTDTPDDSVPTSNIVHHLTSSTSPTNVMCLPEPHSPPAHSGKDVGRISISIDLAYAASRIAEGKVQQIMHRRNSFQTLRKVPTCLCYDNAGDVFAWGLEAEGASSVPGTIRCERFKLFLEPRMLRVPDDLDLDSAVDPRLPRLPPGKRAIDLTVDFLSHLWEYAKEEITREISAVADLDGADVWLTVPATWNSKGCNLMHEAAIAAGPVHASHTGEQDWRDRLHVITEPEAAAVHCTRFMGPHNLKPGQSFMICDAGGGIVDLAMYRVLGEVQNLEIAEIPARSGANCGSLFLDMRFRELVQLLLMDHQEHSDQASLMYFVHQFSEVHKLTYQGESDDDTMFRFTCFNTDHINDPTVGLMNGELALPGILLRREVFDPVIEKVLALIEGQLGRIDHPMDVLLLVGGFSGNEYLFKRVDAQFGQRIKMIVRPYDADTATGRGAAHYGLTRRPLVSYVVAPRAYIMKVKLPAEPEDWRKRPAYIWENTAGESICENRLQYLVSKGMVLRKGQLVKTKLQVSNLTATLRDQIFEAVLYTSDSDRIMRYADEGECEELCKIWGNCPSFNKMRVFPIRMGAQFELGVSVDSAEVRGVLICEGQEMGEIVFDFLS